MSPLLYLIIPPLPILLCPAHFVIPSFCIVRTAESQNVNSVNMYNVHSIFFLYIFTFHMTATTWIAKQFQQNEKVYNRYRNHFLFIQNFTQFYVTFCLIFHFLWKHRSTCKKSITSIVCLVYCSVCEIYTAQCGEFFLPVWCIPI